MHPGLPVARLRQAAPSSARAARTGRLWWVHDNRSIARVSTSSARYRRWRYRSRRAACVRPRRGGQVGQMMPAISARQAKPEVRPSSRRGFEVRTRSATCSQRRRLLLWKGRRRSRKSDSKSDSRDQESPRAGALPGPACPHLLASACDCLRSSHTHTLAHAKTGWTQLISSCAAVSCCLPACALRVLGVGLG